MNIIGNSDLSFDELGVNDYDHTDETFQLLIPVMILVMTKHTNF